MDCGRASISAGSAASRALSQSPREWRAPCGRCNYPSRRCRCAGAWEPSTARYRRGTSLQSWHLHHHWGGHFVVAQGGNEGDRLPCFKRNGADHPVAARSTPPDPRQVCADRGLVDKHQPGGIKHALLSDPTSACSRHIRSLPFGSLEAFFKGDSVAIE